MLYISKELFSLWNREKLLYCHWKSNEHLLPGLNGETDLDVLLSLNDKERGESILRSLDFLKCKSQFGSRYLGVEDWIGFDKETGTLIHLHLHYRLATGHKGLKEYSLPWMDLALKTRVLNEELGVYTMEPNLELVTLYTRIGLKADFISLLRCKNKYFELGKNVYQEIIWLKDSSNTQTIKKLLESFYGLYTSEMLHIINKKKIDAKTYFRLHQITEKVFKKNSYVVRFMRLKEISLFCYHLFLKKIINRFSPEIMKKTPYTGKGLMITFLGQDGAGKTTITNDLLKWLGWKMDVNYYYLGSGENYSSISKKIAKMLPTKGLGKYLRGFFQIWSLRGVAKDSYSKMKRADKYIAKGGVAIIDRFPQMVYPGINDGPKVREKLIKYFGKGFLFHVFEPIAVSEEKYLSKIVSKQPHLVFKLILPPEESIRRKPYENINSVKRKHEIIKSLIFDKSDVYTIDATMPYKEELLNIKKYIWLHIQK